jgi:Plavaka transposase
MLIGYLPTTKLETIENKSARRRALVNLFHSCVRRILGPISSYGETGIAMLSGDGVWRRCHPILACFVGDYPEQALVTCTYFGRCPKCQVPPGQLGEHIHFPTRDYNKAVDAYLLADGDVRTFHAACLEQDLKPVFHPFWESLPLVNIFLSITPDVLHQLLQGVMKHLIYWITSSSVFGPVAIDARCRMIPPNHHIMLFSKGISTLSRVTGKEHKSICRILLGLIIDLPLPHGRLPTRLLRAVRALLDFLYLAQLPSHTTDTIHRLNDSVTRFHQNKDIFVELGSREHFNIPKFHSLLHYASSITLFGATDNYSTEQTERLHIDFAKEAYRATNHKDELSQMTTWLVRREKVQQHSAFVKWQHEDHEQTNPTRTPIGPPRPDMRSLKMTLHPSVKSVSFDVLASSYGALDFLDALADFIAHLNHPGASTSRIQSYSRNLFLSFSSVAVFHKIKFTLRGKPNEVVDTIHVRPEQNDVHGRIVPARFDTVLVRGKRQDSMHGKDGEL